MPTHTCRGYEVRERWGGGDSATAMKRKQSLNWPFLSSPIRKNAAEAISSSKPPAKGTVHAGKAQRKPSQKGFDIALRAQLCLEHCSSVGMCWLLGPLCLGIAMGGDSRFSARPWSAPQPNGTRRSPEGIPHSRPVLFEEECFICRVAFLMATQAVPSFFSFQVPFSHLAPCPSSHGHTQLI